MGHVETNGEEGQIAPLFCLRNNFYKTFMRKCVNKLEKSIALHFDICYT
jgi:hypothetical protein